MEQTVHTFGGFDDQGALVAVRCRCGWSTHGRSDPTQALLEWATRHGWSAPTCERCGRDRASTGASADRLHVHLRVGSTASGGECLVCADDTRTCEELAQTWAAHGPLDDLGIPRPPATVVPLHGRRG